ncbi:MAG: hypothetical protein M1825_002558 [Sarcosagium campestre]|nr:MAG: hypothetical protein M1825_002558 [Sarcosagium campestre]
MVLAPFSRPSWSALLVSLIAICSLVAPTAQVQYVEAQGEDGKSVRLDNVRRPALYTKNYGDCAGDPSSILNVTRFDVAYYKDNMTVLFHLQGSTNVKNESLMLQIGVYAYGENRFSMLFNPCFANIESMCPMKRDVPIEANGIIPVSQKDVAGIPPIALAIPDFEGQAVLRVFANSTQSQIGCYSALVTNGNTMSHPAAIGTVLGLFTIVAIVASFATAIYGDDVRTIRKHYAHSLSLFVVFAVFHHIFYLGALSMNWPSVLPAFWSNYAWTAGMIYSRSMQNSINRFVGSNLGNTSVVGAAGSGTPEDGLGGGYELSKIYKRAANRLDAFGPFKRAANDEQGFESFLSKRGIINETEGYKWYGKPVSPGMPLPGNFSGLAGTLSAEDIPASNAFMTGFLWILILIVILIGSIAAFKWGLEGLTSIKLVRKDRLKLFRDNWITFTMLTLQRLVSDAATLTMFLSTLTQNFQAVIVFFMMLFLTLFQFTYKGSAGPTAIAAIVFLVFFVGMSAIAAYACYFRLRFGHYKSEPDRIYFQRTHVFKVVPWLEGHRQSQLEKAEGQQTFVGSIPWWRIHYIDNDPERTSAHDDAEYLRKFGWLSARFRRTRWWFFAAWFFYEFVRACFFGGAAGHPMTQVFGLLVVETIALVTIISMRPFEGARLNVVMVYLLGFSKVTTVALSAAFAARFNMPRIITTAIGIVIIVIQGILTIALLIAITIGAISSYMSLSRNREEFKPKGLAPTRQRYFAHIEKAAHDLPPPPPPEPQPPIQPYFSVASVRRQPKIEDEDDDFLAEINDPSASRISLANLGSRTGSRRNSVGQSSVLSHSNLPWGARVHRASWSTRDFENYQESNSPRNSDPIRPTSTYTSMSLLTAAGPSNSSTSLSTRKLTQAPGSSGRGDQRVSSAK